MCACCIIGLDWSVGGCPLLLVIDKAPLAPKRKRTLKPRKYRQLIAGSCSRDYFLRSFLSSFSWVLDEEGPSCMCTGPKYEVQTRSTSSYKDFHTLSCSTTKYVAIASLLSHNSKPEREGKGPSGRAKSPTTRILGTAVIQQHTIAES